MGTKPSNHFTLCLLYQTTERMLLKYWLTANLQLLAQLGIVTIPYIVPGALLQSSLFTFLLAFLRFSTNSLVYSNPPKCLKQCLKESSQRLYGHLVTYLWVQEWFSFLSFKIFSEYLTLYPLRTTLLSRPLYHWYAQPSTLDGTVRSLRVKLKCLEQC